MKTSFLSIHRNKVTQPLFFVVLETRKKTKFRVIQAELKSCFHQVLIVEHWQNYLTFLSPSLSTEITMSLS